MWHKRQPRREGEAARATDAMMAWPRRQRGCPPLAVALWASAAAAATASAAPPTAQYAEALGAARPGSDLHAANFSSLSAAREWCNAHALCRGYTYQNGTALPPPPPRTTPCFFRANVNLSACANATASAVYLLDSARSRWTLHNNTKCEPPGVDGAIPAGATVPRGPYGPDGPWGTWGRYDIRSGEWSANASLAQCQAACLADQGCTAVVVTAPGLPPPPPPSPPLVASARGSTYTVYFKLGIIGIDISDPRWVTAVKQNSVNLITVATPLGGLRGVRVHNADFGSFDQFLGIRYAEPIGNASGGGGARWRHAAPKRAWGGVVDALQAGAACPSQAQPPEVNPEAGSAWWPTRPYPLLHSTAVA